jgi:glycosyltransferase involved in cell wall biosynthesis
VTHGTLVKRYGIETLLQAVNILRTQIPTIQLEVLGEGQYRPELEAMADRLELGAHVRFTGWLPSYDEVAARLAAADLAVVALWTDFQLCIKLMDYLALGLPIVTTESAALRTYLDDTEVCYVEPKDPQALAHAVMSLYLDGYSYTVIGEMIDCDCKTVDNALQRVKRKVGAHLDSRAVLA